MKRSIIYLMLGLVLVLTPCCVTDSLPSPYVMTSDEAMSSTCYIRRAQGSGTCFHIGGGMFLTNNHVIMDHYGHYPEFTINGFNAKLITANKSGDWALVRCESLSTIKAFRICTKELELLEKVYSIGWHFGQVKSMSLGHVSFISPKGYVTTTALNGGCSGGPLLNVKFEVCGINRAIMSRGGDWAGVSYHIKITEVDYEKK